MSAFSVVAKITGLEFLSDLLNRNKYCERQHRLHQIYIGKTRWSVTFNSAGKLLLRLREHTDSVMDSAPGGICTHNPGLRRISLRSLISPICIKQDKKSMFLIHFVYCVYYLFLRKLYQMLYLKHIIHLIAGYFIDWVDNVGICVECNCDS